jgi:hypothetical protein
MEQMTIEYEFEVGALPVTAVDDESLTGDQQPVPTDATTSCPRASDGAAR